MKKLYIEDFKIDKKKKSIHGILFEPIKTLGGAKFSSEEFPAIKGFVIQVFQKDSSRRMNQNPTGFMLKEGDWFGTIYFDSGFELIEFGKVKTFSLRERSDSKNEFPSKILKSGQGFEKFVKMNKPYELTSFDIDLRGGSTGGSGRNEHGKPHFHVLKKNSRSEIAKVEIPKNKVWLNCIDKLKLINVVEGFISKSQKREIVMFFEENNNLERLNNQWDDGNKFNNRIIK